MRRILTAAVSVIALAGSVLGFARPAAALDPAEPQFESLFTIRRVEQLTSLGDRLAFTATATGAYRLFGSDGTSAGTEVLTPDGVSTNDRVAGTVDGVAYIRATEASTGSEPWVSDGTVAGTELLADTVPGAGGSTDLSCPAAFGSRVLLTIQHATSGREPWISDGPDGDTTLLNDIVAGSGSSWPCEYAEIRGLAVFGAGVDTELWVTDGSEEGTEGLADLRPGGSESSSPRDFVRLGDRVVFQAEVDDGQQPFWTDGVDVEPLGDVNPAGGGLCTFDGPVIDDARLFVSGDGCDELWRTDGTVEGTEHVTTAPTSYLTGATVVDGVAFFASAGTALWRTDGTADGTFEVIDFDVNSDFGIANLTAFQGRLWLTVAGGVWTSNGTEAGTIAIESFDAEVFDPRLIEATDDALYVGARPHESADDDQLFRVLLPPTPPTEVQAELDGRAVQIDWSQPTHDNGREVSGYTVEVSPGDTSVTVDADTTTLTLPGLDQDTEYTIAVHALNDIGASDPVTATVTTDPGPASETSDGSALDEVGYATSIPMIVGAGDRMVFTARDGASGPWHLFGSDGTEDGTEQLTTNAVSQYFDDRVGDHVYLKATDDDHGLEPWVTDGTPAGTQLLADIVAGPNGVNGVPVCAGALGDRDLLTLDTDGVNSEPWITEGPGGSTTLVADINPGPGYSFPCGYTDIGGRAVFQARDATHGFEPWVTDGTTGGTSQVADINPGPNDSYSAFFTVVGGGAVFLADGGSLGFEPYWTDGEEVRALGDTSPGGDGVYSVPFVLGDTAVFASSGGTELWRTDGTVDGTEPATELPTGSTLEGGVVDGGALYFLASGDGGGIEVWRTDGTEDGTFPVSDLPGGEPGGLTVFQGRIWFVVGTDEESQLWMTDGTVDGALEVASFDIGADQIRELEATDDALFLVTSRAPGAPPGGDQRLYRLALPPTPPTGIEVDVATTTATVSWAAPENDNGREITSYEVTVGDTTLTTTDTAAEVTGLDPATAYTFSVTATNALGSSPVGSVAGTTGALPTTTTTTTSTTTTSTTTSTTTTSTTSTTTSTTTPDRARGTTSTTRPTTSTITPPSTTTTTSTTVAVSTGTGAVIVNEETGEIEVVDPVTPDGVDATGTVVTEDGETISVDADGTVYGGDGVPIGDLDDEDLNGDIVGIALYSPVTKANDDDELAYWLVGADGGVFSFGGAPFLGSMGARPLAAKIVGIVPHGRGYWLIAEDGGVFAFGSAPFLGSMGGRPLAAPITSMTPSTAGYWLVAADGGVFTFGNARFRGSLGGAGSASPVAGLLPDADGYWLIRDDGSTVRFS